MRRSRIPLILTTALAAVAWGLVAVAPASVAESNAAAPRTIDLSQDVGSFAVAYSPRDRHVYVAGNMPDGTGDIDVFLRKYTYTGTLQWERLVSTSASEFARGVAVDRQGNPVVVGWRETDDGDDVLVARFTSGGRRLWVKTYDDVFSGDDRANAVAVDSAGSIWVAGRVPGASDGSAEVWWSRWTATGVMAQEWVAQTTILGWSEAFGITVKGSNVYLAGETFEVIDGAVGSSSDAWLGAYTNTGLTRWERTWGSRGVDDRARAVAVSSDNQVYVTGEVYSTTTGDDIFLRRYTNSGRSAWSRVVKRAGNDTGRGVAVSGNGDTIVVAGTLRADEFSSDAVLYSRTSGGNFRWLTVVPSAGVAPGVSTPDAGLAIAYGGRFFVGGRLAPTMATMDYAWPWVSGVTAAHGDAVWTDIFDPLVE